MFIIAYFMLKGTLSGYHMFIGSKWSKIWIKHFFAKALDLFSLRFFLVLLPLIFFAILMHMSLPSSKRKSLPPGPKPWPIIGNILHIGKNPHVSFTNFAKIHGPLISLRLGTQLLVVGSSPQAATDILKTHDRLLSARHIPNVLPRGWHVLDRIALIWATECTDQWRRLRTLCRTQLFSTKSLELHAILREKKVREMVKLLVAREGKVVNVGQVVFDTAFNTLANLVFSKDLVGLEEINLVAGGLKSLVHDMTMLLTVPNIADFYPMLGGLDPQGLRRKLTKLIKEMYQIWGIDIKERRERHLHDNAERDFLDVFLANGFDDDQISWLSMELFAAATDTTSTTIEWAMAELLKNKQVMKQVREEIRREIDRNNMINESHMSQLPYLDACVKETLRLHPPAPLLLPHRALENCEVMKYMIPKNTQILVNVWAIGRDPSAWEDPLYFKPERFIGSNLDFKGQDYEFLPFGSGRRSCPGLSMSAKQLPLILASLIHYFDWSLPNGEDIAKLDMNEKFGTTLQKEQPLLLVPKKRF